MAELQIESEDSRRKRRKEDSSVNGDSSASKDPTDFISAEHWVIIRLPSENSKLVQLKAGSKVDLGKFGSFKADEIIGKPYGLTYEIFGNAVRVVEPSLSDDLLAELESAEESASNKELVDDPNSQKLTHDDINILKKNEADSKVIVQTIIQNSATFDTKTEYSKAKYLKRKKSKFTKIFFPMRTDARTVTDFFFGWNPQKIMELRIDTLATMLSCANVHANTRLLAVDETSGLLTGAILERLGGFGLCLSLHESENRNFDALRYMNLSAKVAEPLQTLPLHRIEPQEDEQKPDFSHLNESDAQFQIKLAVTAVAKIARDRAARNILRRGGFDALVSASEVAPILLLRKLHPFISGGRPFVFFSPYREVLQESLMSMRTERLAVNVHLSEGWIRLYQVLKNRTHPEMTTSGSGGYILWGTTSLEEPRSAVEHVDETIPAWYVERKDRRENRKQAAAARGRKAVVATSSDDANVMTGTTASADGNTEADTTDPEPKVTGDSAIENSDMIIDE